MVLLLDLKVRNMNMITVFEILFILMILYVNLRNMYDLICQSTQYVLYVINSFQSTYGWLGLRVFQSINHMING